MGDLRKVGVLWRKTDKAGGTYYTGSLDREKIDESLAAGETRLLLFPEREKRNPKGPDASLFCAPDDQTRRAQPERPQERVAPRYGEPHPPPVDDDSIIF